MKKRIITIALVCTMALSLSACAGSGNGSGEASKTNGTSTAVSDSNNSAAASDSGEKSEAAPQTSEGKNETQISAKSGKDVYEFYNTLTEKMSNKFNELQDKHNEAAGDDYSAMVNILYMPFNALRYLDLVYFTEGITPESVQNSFKILGNDDATVTQNGTNSYTIEYTAKSYSSDATYKSKTLISFDTENLGASIVFYKDGKLSSFTEMQAIGNDQYAFSTETDRAIVTYQNGEVTAFTHAENTYEDDFENGGFTKESYVYDYNDESKVFGKTSKTEDWVKEAEKHDALHRLYVLKDNVIRITGLKDVFNYGKPKSYEPGYDVTLP